MTEQFFSLKEAAQYTGKSHSSLRRFLEKITKAEKHADRNLIHPNVDEVTRLHEENHPFSWRVSTVLLDREFAKQGSDPTPPTNSSSEATASAYELLSRTIAMLETELAAKNKQIDDFLERQRETNILLLPEGKQKQAQSDEAVTVYSSNDTEEGSQHGTFDSEEPEQKSETKRESLWDRMRKKPIFQR